MHSEELVDAASQLPSNLGRASTVQRLLETMPGLVSRLNVFEPPRAAEQELLSFHTRKLVCLSHLRLLLCFRF
jgi:hypothetical protein